MADEEILDIEGDFDVVNALKDEFPDVNDLPSKSANLLPEFTSPEWMLEQGWSLDSYIDEKSKATIEKMLLEEQHYMNGYTSSKGLSRKGARSSPGSKSKKATQLSHGGPSSSFGQFKEVSSPGERDSTAHIDLMSTHSFEDTLASITTGQPTVQTALATSRKRKGKSTDSSVSKSLFSKKVNTTQAKKLKANKQNTKTSTSTISQNNSHHHLVASSNLFKSDSPLQKGLELQALLIRNDNSLLKTTSLVSSKVQVVMKDEKIVEESDEDEEVDIDIENDSDENTPLLQDAPNSQEDIYQHLLQSSDMNNGKDYEDNCADEDLGDNDLEDKIDEEIDEKEDKNDIPYVQPELFEDNDGACSNDFEEKNQALSDNEEKDQGLTVSYLPDFVMKTPIEEKILPPDIATEEEIIVHKDFFDGRPPKTPERYLKIRNYILECWLKSKPSFLNKTKIRSGLKNCGDVNCIGRIHAYLEWSGAINFDCDQAVYNNIGRLHNTGKQRIRKETSSSQKDQKPDCSMPRKRRIKDEDGAWVDPKELEGKTIPHEIKPEVKIKPKVKKIQYDPFKLVTCQDFSQDYQAPFKVSIHSSALAVMDLHSHVSKTEVIGMLGGHFTEAHGSTPACLSLTMALPCKSLSTGMQCEMCPVSQIHAKEVISSAGLQVVGWYHSHPTFRPDPSIRDIETQMKFQHWFSQGGNHFVGLIVSPYNSHNPSLKSHVQCLTVSDQHSQEFMTNLPYKFPYSVVYTDQANQIMECAKQMVEDYCTYFNRVRLTSTYMGVSCLSKMLQSVKQHLTGDAPPPPPLLSQPEPSSYHPDNSDHSLSIAGDLGDLSDPSDPCSSGQPNHQLDDEATKAFLNFDNVWDDTSLAKHSYVPNLLQDLESLFINKF